jgi:hypothetical protein
LGRFSCTDGAFISLALGIGLTWAILGLALLENAHADFLDWSEMTLSAAGFAGLIPAFGGPLLHRRLSTASRGKTGRPGSSSAGPMG